MRSELDLPGQVSVLAHEVLYLRAVIKRAVMLIDQSMGDTDPTDSAHPLLRACNLLVKEIRG
jgi:hypothetical protein